MREIGIVGQEKLYNGSVLVIGAGGLGSNVIMHLAAAGVGKLGIVDSDRVEMSNLNRQVIHSVETLGMSKVESAKRFVASLDPDAEVEALFERVTAENIAPLIAKYDFVVDCTDDFATKFLINDACVLGGKPFCHGGVTALDGQIMTVLPGGPCLRCVLGDIPFDAPTCSDFGVLGSVVGVIGSLQATEAIKYLAGFGSVGGKLLSFDGRTAEFRSISLKRDKSCPVCGKHDILELKSETYMQKGECNGR